MTSSGNAVMDNMQKQQNNRRVSARTSDQDFKTFNSSSSDKAANTHTKHKPVTISSSEDTEETTRPIPSDRRGDSNNQPPTMSQTGGRVAHLYKQVQKNKAQQAEMAVDYLLHQLSTPQVRDDPLATVSALYLFKALLEKSPMPCILQLCYDRGFLSVLVRILDREFDPADGTNELLLYHLAMEILWWFSRVSLERPKRSAHLPLLDRDLLGVVTRYTDLCCRFFQFSPLFSRRVKELCDQHHFQSQRVTVWPVTPQVWGDVTFYQPWMWSHGPLPCVYLCSLATPHHPIAPHLTSQGLAWPSGPQSAPLQPPSPPALPLSPPLADQSPDVPSAREDSGQDVVFLDTLGGPYFWAYIGSCAGDVVQDISCVLREELSSLKTCCPQVGDMVIVTEGESGEGVSSRGTEKEEGCVWSTVPEGGRGREDVVETGTQGGQAARHNMERAKGDITNTRAGGKGDNRKTERRKGDITNTAREGVKGDNQNLERRKGDITNTAREGGKGDNQNAEGRKGATTATATEVRKGEHPRVMRARVLTVGEGEVGVFAVDYGMVTTVKSTCVYQMSGRSRGLDRIEPQAKLCCLAGVQAPPASEATLHLALAFLTNLAKHYPDPGLVMVEGQRVRQLCALAQVAPPSLRLQVLRLLANLSSPPSPTRQLDCSPLVGPLLEMVERAGSEGSLDRGQCRCLVAALCALNNALYLRPSSKDLFFQLNGQAVLLRVAQQYRQTSPQVVKAVVGVMRVVFSGLMTTFFPHLHPSSRLTTPSRTEGSSSETCREREGKVDREGREARPEEHRTGNLNPGEWSEGDDQTTRARLMPRHYLKQEALKLRAAQGEGRRGEGPGNDGREEDNDDNDDSRPHPASSPWGGGRGQQDICLLPHDCLPGLTDASERPRDLPDPAGVISDLPVVSGAEIKPDCDSYYEYNSVVPFVEGQHHQFVDIDRLSDLSPDLLTQLITAMLNSDGGTIYLGISRQGMVRGVRIMREDRESLRAAVDEVTARTTPVVPHTLLQLACVAVRSHTTPSPPSLDRVFVVEMVVKRPVDKVFYTFTLEKRRVCYHRLGAQTRQLTEQDVRAMVVQEREKQYLPIILSLKQCLRQLQEETTPAHHTPPL